MLVAADVQNKRLILGLDAENIRLLQDDKPIEARLNETAGMRKSAPELAQWTLHILGPEDMVRFIAHYAGKDVIS